MITISKKTEYSLLLVEYLRRKQGQSVSLTQISEETGMPYRFLSQLAGSLKLMNVLESKEGKSGGYWLKEGWEKKSIYELLAGLGEDKHMVSCLGDTKCLRSGKCSAQKVWGKLELLMTKELKKIKLEEI